MTTKTSINGRMNNTGPLLEETVTTKPTFPLPEWCRKLMPGTWMWMEEIWVGLVTIQPEAAGTILRERNIDNRDPIPAQLAVLQHAVETNNFSLTGDTIKFNWEQKGIDLQHRLTACERGGKPIRTLVVYGVAPFVFKDLDQHGHRPLSQVLKIEKEENPTELGGTLNFLHYFAATGIVARGRARSLALTNTELLAGRQKFPGIRNSVAFAVEHKKAAKRFTGPNLLATLHWIFTQADRDLTDEFLLSVLDNSVPRGSRWAPVAILASLLEDNLNPRRSLHGMLTQVYTIKAWNALREGKRVERLRWGQKEKFPRASGLTYTDDGRPVLGS